MKKERSLPKIETTAMPLFAARTGRPQFNQYSPKLSLLRAEYSNLHNSFVSKCEPAKVFGLKNCLPATNFTSAAAPKINLFFACPIRVLGSKRTHPSDVIALVKSLVSPEDKVPGAQSKRKY